MQGAHRVILITKTMLRKNRVSLYTEIEHPLLSYSHVLFPPPSLKAVVVLKKVINLLFLGRTIKSKSI